jgi:DHA2 family multidrug resistance protein-like MFS transporter
VLGLAGATLAPSTLSLIRNMFHDPQQRTVAIGVWISSYSAGAAIGPVLGGVLLEYFWWGSVFLVGVPVMVLLLAVGPTLLPEYRDPNAGRLDLVSAVLSLLAVLATIYGLKRAVEVGFGWAQVLCVAAGAVLGLIFLRRQATLADPMIDLRLFRTRAFSAALATYMLGTFVGFGIFIFIAQHMQLVLGMGPLTAGLWTAPFAGAFIVGSMLTPLIVRGIRPGYVIAGGLALAAVGFAMLTRIDQTSGIGLLVTALVVYSLGLAPVFTLATDLVVGSAPPERAGAASAISETASEFGGALGIAILGSIGAAIYRSEMAAALPAGIPPATAEAARQTLGGAVTVAGRLPEGLGASLVAVAREAFAQSFELAAAVSAGLLVVLAIVSAVLLRRAGPDAEPGEAPEPVAVPAR